MLGTTDQARDLRNRLVDGTTSDGAADIEISSPENPKQVQQPAGASKVAPKLPPDMFVSQPVETIKADLATPHKRRKKGSGCTDSHN
jgi:hypothetical protein